MDSNQTVIKKPTGKTIDSEDKDVGSMGLEAPKKSQVPFHIGQRVRVLNLPYLDDEYMNREGVVQKLYYCDEKKCDNIEVLLDGNDHVRLYNTVSELEYSLVPLSVARGSDEEAEYNKAYEKKRVIEATSIYTQNQNKLWKDWFKSNAASRKTGVNSAPSDIAISQDEEFLAFDMGPGRAMGMSTNLYNEMTSHINNENDQIMKVNMKIKMNK